MADGFNLAQAGTMSPEDYAQQQQLNRQQQMAQLLLQQGSQQPQGQMVSGRYVPTSFFQNLVPIANIAASKYIGEKADTEGAKLAEQLRQRRISEAEAISGATTPEEQLKVAMSGYSPLSQQLASKLIERKFKEPKWEKVEKLDARGNTITGMVDVNSANPENTFRTIGIGKQAISPAEAARLNWEGIPYGGGGMPSGNAMPTGGAMPSGSMPSGAMPQNAPQGAMPQVQIPTQANMPQGNTQVPLMPPLNLAGLSPKAAQEAKTKYAEDLQANVKNAYEVAKVAPEIEKVLPKAHGSGLGNIIGGAQNFFGIESDKNAADAQLKVMSDKLLKAVPRFSGPQSDKDVASYKEAAGSIGDPTLPMNVRMAALETIKNLNKPYAPNLNWDTQTGTEKAPEKVSLSAPMYATNGSQRIMSTDGGKTWKPAR